MVSSQPDSQKLLATALQVYMMNDTDHRQNFSVKYLHSQQLAGYLSIKVSFHQNFVLHGCSWQLQVPLYLVSQLCSCIYGYSPLIQPLASYMKTACMHIQVAEKGDQGFSFPSQQESFIGFIFTTDNFSCQLISPP